MKKNLENDQEEKANFEELWVKFYLIKRAKHSPSLKH
jgi:hypothetical protein